MESLPGDILSNIFMRIPAKHLGQVRCVSKTLNDHLSKHSFIKLHMIRSIKNNNKILLFLINASELRQVEGSVKAYYDGFLDEELPGFLYLPSIIPPSQYDFVKFYGSVNGLICINFRPFEHELVRGWVLPDDTNSIFLIWNPSLSAVSTLPRCNFPIWNLENGRAHVRFGYDPQANDYKIVNVIGKGISREGLVNQWLQVEVYSMRKGVWEVIPKTVPSHVIKIWNADRCCADGYNGHLHWLGKIRLGKRIVQTIVAFDLSAESFSEIPLPTYTSRFFWESIGFLRGKLSLMALNGNDKCEVWIMKEYGKRSSWTRTNILSRLSGIGRPYGFTSSNKFLFAVPGDFSFRLYDLNSAEVKSMDEEHGDIRIIRYADSLAWIASPRDQE